MKASRLRIAFSSHVGWWSRAAPIRGWMRHGGGQTSLIAFLVPTGASTFAGRNRGKNYMKNTKYHRQRRHRKRPSRRRYLWMLVVSVTRILDLLMSWME